MAVLLLAEVSGGELALDATAKAVTAGKALGEVTVLVAGPAAAADAAACRTYSAASSQNGDRSLRESSEWTG